MSVPVVVGAFPEPFLHGFQWAKPGATVIYWQPDARPLGGSPPRSAGTR